MLIFKEGQPLLSLPGVFTVVSSYPLVTAQLLDELNVEHGNVPNFFPSLHVPCHQEMVFPFVLFHFSEHSLLLKPLGMDIEGNKIYHHHTPEMFIFEAGNH